MSAVRHRLDYRPPDWRIPAASLLFELDAESTRVTARLAVVRHEKGAGGPLVLDGIDLELASVAIDGRVLAADEYVLAPETLTIKSPPDEFEIETAAIIHPSANTRLEGLYASKNGLFTQCEAEGFRRITWFLDRPDNLTQFSVRLEGDAARFPVLLSNGNPLSAGNMPDGRHYAVWHDPFPKPSYLFALVAGELSHIEDTFQTMSARNVLLRIYCEGGDEERCRHAMRAIRQAMAWDEKAYGCEYDLDVFNVAAVHDFNAGAMENKGLNIFNAKCVLADAEMATDADFSNITRIIGHEYFHNWSGDRVTCRDWFQLSLKEGFTVFREQHFMADIGSPGVERIKEARDLRARQFSEDSGPMAHPVRPDSYEEINNFYTATVYEKGAEVIRMMRTVLGERAFRTGCDLYFAMHDGKAATCEDFVQALEISSGVNLSGFRLWYEQAGTPVVSVKEEYDAAKQAFTLTLRQTVPPTPGQPEKKPMPIPVDVAMLGRGGGVLVQPQVLLLDAEEKSFRFPRVAEKPVVSILRGFSAPVKLIRDMPVEDALLLLRHDDDAFSRWDALQTILRQDILSDAADVELPPNTRACFAALTSRPESDHQLHALLLALPDESALAEDMQPINAPLLRARLRRIRSETGKVFAEGFAAIWQRNMGAPAQDISADAAARRLLANTALRYLAAGDGAWIATVEKHFAEAGNMTDRLAALSILVDAGGEAAENALAAFYARHKGNAIALNKWFAAQARGDAQDVCARVAKLTEHPDFNWRNPNRVRALLSVFSEGNPGWFHAQDGAGYRLLGDAVLLLDKTNPHLAACLMEPFSLWRRHAEPYYTLMRKELERIAATPDLSVNVREIITKTLG